ncbi:MAG TPA: cytochrome b/b6 domain-containing protein [Bryobacteraceae bacterium]|jgi:thiosulfate reductase cytochrome b subunit|nr:cytochrome b/b6 domain-containing protein [Bryobacteraceae bacterium]
MKRHTRIVRVAHWLNALAFFGLAISGVAILLAHPRLYWGESGAVGMPSLIDLPLPFLLTGQSGWGRSLHFLSAWVAVFNGLLYFTGFRSGAMCGYGGLQRLAYSVVVFLLFPLMIWTGFAMSPAITSVAPVIVTALGGQQSARTIHFFAADALVLFLFGHVAMVWLTGFRKNMRAMVFG